MISYLPGLQHYTAVDAFPTRERPARALSHFSVTRKRAWDDGDKAACSDERGLSPMLVDASTTVEYGHIVHFVALPAKARSSTSYGFA